MTITPERRAEIRAKCFPKDGSPRLPPTPEETNDLLTALEELEGELAEIEKENDDYSQQLVSLIPERDSLRAQLEKAVQVMKSVGHTCAFYPHLICARCTVDTYLAANSAQGEGAKDAKE